MFLLFTALISFKCMCVFVYIYNIVPILYVLIKPAKQYFIVDDEQHDDDVKLFINLMVLVVLVLINTG